MSAGDRNNPDPTTQRIVDIVTKIPGVARKFARPYQIVRTKQIPYLAGYSQNGAIIYIDRDMPADITFGAGKTISGDEFLAIHERWEKAIVDSIQGGDIELWRLLPHAGDDADDPYYPAHGVATWMEETAVKNMFGADGLAAYRAFMTQQVKRAMAQTLMTVPTDLDMTPYIPAETPEDYRVVKAMQDAMAA